jgi:di/tricarboxylate transporter
MTFQIALVFVLLAVALVVFALEIWPIDFVAFSIMAVILVLGPVLGLEPNEVISGFSNPATITVLAMFILSSAVYRTGAINHVARKVIPLAGDSELGQLAVILLIAGPISAFINNTAVVAILIPLVLTMARRYDRAPSKLLLPLSFFSQLAGVVTLIGTSTNILASSLTAQAGLEPFGMFEFAAIGLLVASVGSLYLFTLGRKLLPERHHAEEISDKFVAEHYLTEVRIAADSPLGGKTLVESRLSQAFDIDVLSIERAGQRLGVIQADERLEPGDRLLLRASRERLLLLRETEGLDFVFAARRRLSGVDDGQLHLMEVVIGPDSDLIGGTLASTNFRNRFNCTVIAMQRRGAFIDARFSDVRLGFGDTLLLQGERGSLEQLKREPGFIVTEELEEEEFRSEKIKPALIIVAGVVGVAALGIAPILVSSMVGCVLMVLTGCLKPQEMHRTIRWDVIFLLAGVIPLGLAFESTGAAELLADQAAHLAEGRHPIFVIAAFYIMAAVLTEMISNNATVVVMVPVAIVTGASLGLDARALILAIMFAASTSFSTPVGYQTNTMIFGPGGYRFLDFTRVGLPLNLILAAVTPFFIYWIWGV